MHDYTVYGGWLRSGIPIPELRPRKTAVTTAAVDAGSAEWDFQVVTGSPPELPNGVRTARDELHPGVFAELFRGPNMCRLTFDDTGVFDVSDAGRRVVWYPRDGCEHDVARADLVGRVLPLTLHDQGLTSLHGSAVVLDGRAVAFLAPKNHGKSTLAMGLVERHGARLLSDDTLIVAPDSGIARAGVPSVRLWEHTAQHFDGLGGGREVLSEKHVFEQMPPEWLAEDATPISAIYALAPTPAGSPDAVRRYALDGAEATIALIQYQKLGALLAGLDAVRVFELAATLASHVPVFRLEVARDLERLPDVTSTIVSWHQAHAHR
jgi:hypothetical protein